MKRIIALAAALAMCVSLASCVGKQGGTAGKTIASGADTTAGKATQSAGETTTCSQSPVQIKQAELIKSFGVTQKSKSIVCFRTTDKHIEYIVCKYNEDGSRKSQSIYVIYYDPSYYRNGIAELANKPGCETYDDAESIKYTSDLFEIGGSYAKDYLKITQNMKDYTVVDNVL